MSDDRIVDEVVGRIQKRSAAGMKKFGKPMTRDDRTTIQWIDDTIEELLDAAVYLTRVKSDLGPAKPFSERQEQRDLY